MTQTLSRLPYRSDEQEALLTVVQRLRKFPVARALLTVVMVLHLWGALTLIYAPHVQLFTQGTRPVFDLFPPGVWAVAFCVGGVTAAALLARFTIPRMFVTWLTVLPTQAVWLAASVLAVSRGGGSAMGIVFLTPVLASTAITAVVVAMDYTTGKR
ncbi:MAG: hypothetical protein HOV96_40975 [Nonomuraea sp.]|nr:hypothetical protein [Nonomuraea sp.]NUR27330.1 hypothetical protein [Catenulispora sp.]NUR71114.1 hypothetical protein [Hamadaea sp.]